MSTRTSLQRQIDQAHSLRFAMACGAVIDVFLIAVDLIRGSATALVPAVLLVILLMLVFVETRVIRTLERARELSRRADGLDLTAEAVSEAAAGVTMASLGLGFARLGADLGPCAHASAEPVDLLLTGERVAWVCPDCNAELPAGWTPAKTVLRGEVENGTCATLSGTGSLSARAAHVPGYAAARTDDEIAAARAAIHFETLARVGLEHCLSYCPICLYRLFGPMPDGVKPDASMWRWTEENWGWKR